VELGGKLEIEWNENAAIWEKVESVDPTRGWTFVRRVREDAELGDRSIFERIQWSQYGYREPWFQPDARWSRVEFFGHMISQGVWQHEGPWNQRGIMNLNEAEVKWHDYETTKQQLHRVWSHSLYHSCPRGVIMGWQEDKPPSGWRFLDDIPSPDGFRWIQKVEVSVEPTLLGEGTEEVGDISSSMIEETNNEEDKSDK
jgi:hypothetical protein